MTAAARSLQAIIFDLDGTLVDSRLDFAAMRRELSAPEGLGLLEYIDSLADEMARREAMAVVHRHELAGAEAATWMPGAEEVLLRLCDAGVPAAIVTRNSRRAARRTMERLAMPSVPLKAREDAAPKPDPEALLAIAEAWRMPPARCAYVGDFRYDIEAAQRAGMLPVLYVGEGLLPDGHTGEVDVLRHFREILNWFAL
ncbi:MAG: HAD family hydrolase [Halieaceae bacterium]|jgi:HAD superfamily hydrolase (TIGR01549 family)|nr:HAD family hydrolase [Halieaceae bacterium]